MRTKASSVSRVNRWQPRAPAPVGTSSPRRTAVRMPADVRYPRYWAASAVVK